MKRKAIEKIAPVKPTQKGEYITTAQKMDNILILNVYVNGELDGRHALNPKTGEYDQYNARDKSWNKRKYAALLGLDTCWFGWYSEKKVKQRAVFDTPEQEQTIRETLEMAKKIKFHSNTFDMITKVETDYKREMSEKAEKNRKMKIQDKMNLVPGLPEDAREWIWQQEGAKDYVFFDKETGKWHCAACGRGYEEKYLKRTDKSDKVRHNNMAICPRCRKIVIAKRRGREVSQQTHFSLLQKIDNRMSVVRYFDVVMTWNSTGKKIYINEAARILLYHISTLPKYCAEIFYNQHGADGAFGGVNGWDYEYAYFDNKSNPHNRRMPAGFIYPEGIEEALEDTAYKAWGRLFAQMAAAGKKLNYNKLLCTQNRTNLINTVEYLFKGKFSQLLYETTENISLFSYRYYGVLRIYGKSIEEVFDIPDRQLINRIRDIDGGENTVEWLRWSCTHRQKISQETLDWLNKNKISQEDVKFIENKMSLQQIMNYVNRQKAEGYSTRNVKGVLEQWDDYLNMLKKLGRKTDDEMMYRPRELKRRHDECVEEIRIQQIIEDMKCNPKQRAAEARRMRERFPGAEEILKEIKSKYEYRNEKYIILVPQKLIEIVTEGQALHHCAGSSDRYFDRILQRETYICFLRRADYPKVPFYTIEVEPGGTIRQHRGYLDEEPGIEEIKPFLREWQTEIKKRLRKKDREYAEASAVKRQENIEELQAKNNTKVLKGLMEDFMEAI